ncbi:MAG TPA: hypothetical protein VH393_02540 [Ktedonobacterales bacterium]|jgi:hypothetical protein
MLGIILIAVGAILIIVGALQYFTAIPFGNVRHYSIYLGVAGLVLAIPGLFLMMRGRSAAA